MIAIKENSVKIDDHVNDIGGISCVLSDGTTVSALYIKMFANKYVFFFEEDVALNCTRQDICTLNVVFTKYLNSDRIYNKSDKIETISSK